jgi:hypothetical protein
VKPARDPVRVPCADARVTAGGEYPRAGAFTRARPDCVRRSRPRGRRWPARSSTGPGVVGERSSFTPRARGPDGATAVGRRYRRRPVPSRFSGRRHGGRTCPEGPSRAEVVRPGLTYAVSAGRPPNTGAVIHHRESACVRRSARRRGVLRGSATTRRALKQHVRHNLARLRGPPDLSRPVRSSLLAGRAEPPRRGASLPAAPRCRGGGIDRLVVTPAVGSVAR